MRTIKRRRTKIAGQFTLRLVEMLRSPAHRVLSLSARRIINRLEIEHAHHGGTENGNLPVTYEQFVKFGIDRHSIAPAIRETVALGFVEITEKGRAGNAEYRHPNRFRLTFVLDVKAEPTNEWRKIASIEEAKSIAKAARSKQISSGGKYQVSVRETPTGNNSFPVGETPTTDRVKTPTTIYISGRGHLSEQETPRAMHAANGEGG